MRLHSSATLLLSLSSSKPPSPPTFISLHFVRRTINNLLRAKKDPQDSSQSPSDASWSIHHSSPSLPERRDCVQGQASLLVLGFDSAPAPEPGLAIAVYQHYHL